MKHYATCVDWDLMGKFLLLNLGGKGRVVMAQCDKCPTWRTKEEEALKTSEALRHYVISYTRNYGQNGPVSLHAIPDRTRFIVFDFDIRDIAKRWPEKLANCRHDRYIVCSNCWRYAQTAVAIIRSEMEKAMQLPSPPLVVYSGGNGIHVWYHITPFSKQWQLLDSDVGRGLLFNHIAARMAKHCLPLDPGPTRLMPRCKVTGEPTSQDHMIKLPYSLHSATGRVALPIDPDKVPMPASVRKDFASNQIRDAAMATETETAHRLFRAFCSSM